QPCTTCATPTPTPVTPTPTPTPATPTPTPTPTPVGGCARTVNVSTSSSLNTAIGAALPGDCIVLANGSYAGFTVSRDGTPTDPITIRAANRGMATITSGIIHFNQNADVVVEGLSVTTAGLSETIDGSARKTAVWFDASTRCRLT